MSKKGDYGQKVQRNMSADGDMVLPGSPDARDHPRYTYGETSASYGKKVSTTKNKTGTGAPNTGIQGGQERGNSMQTQDKSKSASYGKKASYKKHYGGAAGKTSKGKGMGHDEYDYGKGRMKKGDQRRHVKAQGK